MSVNKPSTKVPTSSSGTLTTLLSPAAINQPKPASVGEITQPAENTAKSSLQDR
jgi:hypothetical protein